VGMNRNSRTSRAVVGRELASPASSAPTCTRGTPGFVRAAPHVGAEDTN